MSSKELITGEQKELASGVQHIMNLFYEVNPTLNFANKTSRGAAEWMIKKWGLPEVERLTRIVIACQGQPFAPVATNPYEMKEKLLKFKLFLQRKINEQRTALEPPAKKMFGEDLRL